MQEFKYTYQDWVDGELDKLDIFRLLRDDELSSKDFRRISLEQSKAYTKLLYNAFETLKLEFASRYKSSFLKSKWLELHIELWAENLSSLEEQYPDIAKTVATSSTDGRYTLTKQQVDQFDYCEINDSLMKSISFNLVIESYDDMPNIYYIIAANYYNWLLWYKESVSKSEPTINYSERDTYEASLKDAENAARQAKQQVSYTWPNLFKNTEQADIILNLLKEHLSSSGQWLTEPKGRHLVALCMELESKGYFKSQNAITNPAKAAAFNAQFDVKLAAKNFQPQKRNDAEDYREHFQHLPKYSCSS
ncbi:hypothetical protein [Pontibacter akesuensis]|uniref:Uncharacterized protein n=1 Tax=Pontibacter akesuensis TaxID=388950 RepID=A0A1I7JN88_9BACT|nr:hypothetical protein [Pontibacter akesuensis]GHA68740.1 hypothetical protein GCM10007389_22190 [Pontibacter akesuensis]SFU86619.1 hypothetical protein SAMN04487941_3055 [Pontibacter akesuensis]